VQYPEEFEFNENILLDLSTLLLENKYGSFISDCEREYMQDSHEKLQHSGLSTVNSGTTATKSTNLPPSSSWSGNHAGNNTGNNTGVSNSETPLSTPGAATADTTKLAGGMGMNGSLKLWG
jgi:hypothetical protein